jgi:hypothetical protein
MPWLNDYGIEARQALAKPNQREEGYALAKPNQGEARRCSGSHINRIFWVWPRHVVVLKQILFCLL